MPVDHEVEPKDLKVVLQALFIKKQKGALDCLRADTLHSWD